jgi:replicative superfamily II helicase
MYTRAAKQEMKEKILSSFSKKAKLHVVVATTTLAWG